MCRPLVGSMTAARATTALASNGAYCRLSSGTVTYRVAPSRAVTATAGAVGCSSRRVRAGWPRPRRAAVTACRSGCCPRRRHKPARPRLSQLGELGRGSPSRRRLRDAARSAGRWRRPLHRAEIGGGTRDCCARLACANTGGLVGAARWGPGESPLACGGSCCRSAAEGGRVWLLSATGSHGPSPGVTCSHHDDFGHADSE